MEAIKGSLGKDGIERYFKFVTNVIDKNGLANGYSVSFEYNIPKDKTTFSIFRFAHGVPVDFCINDKFYCDSQPIITESSFEEVFEKNKSKLVKLVSEYKNENKKCECCKCELKDKCNFKDKYQRLPRTVPGALGLCKKL